MLSLNLEIFHIVQNIYFFFVWNGWQLSSIMKYLPEKKHYFGKKKNPSLFTGSFRVFALFFASYANFQKLKLKCWSPQLLKYVPFPVSGQDCVTDKLGSDGQNLEKCLKILGKKTTETIEKPTTVNFSYFCILTWPCCDVRHSLLLTSQ